MIEYVKHPVFTEKTARLLEKRFQYSFDASCCLRKPQLRSLIQDLFGVKIRSINLHNRRRYAKRKRGKVVESIPKIKRVIVTLVEGDQIIFFSESI